MDKDTPNFEHQYNRLNKEQKEAVDNIEGPIMVLAGPGTGKTQIIAVRIGKILQETQVNPSNILCLTFTDSAVHSMRERLIETIGKEGYQVKIFTFHAFCNDIIHAHPEDFPSLGREAEQLTDIERIEILSALISSLNFDDPLKPFGKPMHYVRSISSLISNFKREGLSPAGLIKLVDTQVDYFNKVNDAFNDFTSLHARKLTEDIVNDFVAQLKSTDAKFPMTKIVVDKFKQIIGEAVSTGDEKLVKKSRTKFKNEIKKIYKQVHSDKIYNKLKSFNNIYIGYQKELKTKNRYDYEDMIDKVVSRFEQNKELLQEYQELYQYILVDEYQDTNSSQNKTIKLLGNFFPNPNIFVVGDDEQSIYRFQGASIENLKFFYDLYEEHIKLISLKSNYRSHQRILDGARSLIKINDSKIEKFIPDIIKSQLAAGDVKTGAIEVIEAENQISEYSFVVDEVSKLVDSGVEPKEIAILYRAHKDIYNLAELMDAKGIKYQTKKTLNILKETVLNQLSAFIEYLVDPLSDDALFKILNFAFLNIDGLDLTKIYRYASKNHLTLGEIITDKIHLKESDVKDEQQFIDIADKLVSWQQQVHNVNSVVFFNDLIRESGYFNYLLSQKNYFELLPKLNRFYNEIKKLDTHNNNYTLVDFIRHLRVAKEYKIDLNITEAPNENSDRIQLLTVHSAKGMEFEYVFIINVTSRSWGKNAKPESIKMPLDLMETNYLTDPKEEERRLFYVAMTRAKKHIYISYPLFNLDDKKQTPSEFIKDIKSDFVEFKSINLSQDDEIDYIKSIFSYSKEINYTEKGREYIKELIKDLKFTTTHLSSYKKCPRCFFMNSILRVPRSKQKSASYGTAVHNALRDLFSKYKRSESLPSLEYLLNSYEYHLRHERLSKEEHAETLEQGKMHLTYYYESEKDSFNPTSLLEINMVSHNVMIGDVPITGKIDRIDFTDAIRSSVNLVDYKTGNPDNKGAALSKKNMGDYFSQLVFYSLLIEGSSQYRWSINDSVIEFIEKSPKKDMIVKKKFQITKEDKSALIEEIKEVYANIQDLKFDEYNNKDCHTPELHGVDIRI